MASTSSIFWMYAWSNSAMHHIFFPPRLQLVALQQNPDCLSAHFGHQLALDGLFGDQADRPTGSAFRRPLPGGSPSHGWHCFACAAFACAGATGCIRWSLWPRAFWWRFIPVWISVCSCRRLPCCTPRSWDSAWRRRFLLAIKRFDRKREISIHKRNYLNDYLEEGKHSLHKYTIKADNMPTVVCDA